MTKLSMTKLSMTKLSMTKEVNDLYGISDRKWEGRGGGGGRQVKKNR